MLDKLNNLVGRLGDYVRHAGTLAMSKTLQGIAVTVVCAFAAKQGWIIDNGTVAQIIATLTQAVGIGFDPAHASQSLPLVGSALGAAWAAYGRKTAQGPLTIIPPKKDGPDEPAEAKAVPGSP